MTTPRILIAGIGNIFFGDDAFGCEVARCLLARELPAGVRVVDFGIRGIDLAYALTDGFDVVILVDAVDRGGVPGALYVIEPNREANGVRDASLEPHALDPWRVLRMADSLGGQVGRVLVIGCQPETCDPEDGRMELSDPVQAAVPEPFASSTRWSRKFAPACRSHTMRRNANVEVTGGYVHVSNW
jgi:hydrogenase maturation protease